MRSITWPWARRCGAVLGAALCLAIAACSGGKGTAVGPSPHHSRTVTAAEPATGPAAVTAVKANWQEIFNGAVPIPRRLGLLQDGSKFAPFIKSQEKTPILGLVLQATARVRSVRLGPPDQATVTYTILLGGKPLASNLHGIAVYTDGAWKASVSTFCGLLRMAYGSKSQLIPAVCGS